jgi:hypothetical protein
MWFSYDFGASTVAVKSLLWLGIPLDSCSDPGPCLQHFFAVLEYSRVDNEKLMKSASTWYSTGSSWPDLPNGCKISRWLYQLPGKLTTYIPASMLPNWRSANSHGILPAAS